MAHVLTALPVWFRIRSAAYVPRAAPCLVALLLLSAPVATAESGAAPSREQFEALQRTIERLNGRVESLEQQLSNRGAAATQEKAGPQPASPASSNVPPAPPLQERWQRIAHGMTVQAVEVLLGRPHRTATLSAKTVWYYSYPDVGSGSVVFAQDGDVIDWQTPPFRTWW